MRPRRRAVAKRVAGVERAVHGQRAAAAQHAVHRRLTHRTHLTQRQSRRPRRRRRNRYRRLHAVPPAHAAQLRALRLALNHRVVAEATHGHARARAQVRRRRRRGTRRRRRRRTRRGTRRWPRAALHVHLVRPARSLIPQSRCRAEHAVQWQRAATAQDAVHLRLAHRTHLAQRQRRWRSRRRVGRAMRRALRRALRLQPGIDVAAAADKTAIAAVKAAAATAAAAASIAALEIRHRRRCSRAQRGRHRRSNSRTLRRRRRGARGRRRRGCASARLHLDAHTAHVHTQRTLQLHATLLKLRRNLRDKRLRLQRCLRRLQNSALRRTDRNHDLDSAPRQPPRRIAAAPVATRRPRAVLQRALVRRQRADRQLHERRIHAQHGRHRVTESNLLARVKRLHRLTLHLHRHRQNSVADRDVDAVRPRRHQIAQRHRGTERAIQRQRAAAAQHAVHRRLAHRAHLAQRQRRTLRRW